MAEIRPFTGGVLLSISQMATEFGMARATIAKAIEALGLQPAAKRGGYPVYRLREAVRVLTADQEGADGRPDPARMKPVDRRAWFQSENERLKFEQDEGGLVLAVEAHSQLAVVAKIVVRELDRLPDDAERDLRCPPETVEYLMGWVRNVRGEISRILLDDEAGGEDVGDACERA